MGEANLKVSQDNCLVYLSNNQVHIDNNKGIFGAIGRFVHSLAGTKNYDVVDVLKFISSSSQKDLSESTIERVYEKAGKKLHVDSRLAKDLAKCIQLSESQESDQTLLHALTDHCLEHQEQIKSLKDFQKLFGSKSNAYKTIAKVLQESYLKTKLAGIQLDVGLAHDFPEDMEFLFKTRLIYAIVGYQNTTEEGSIDHAIRTVTDEKGTVGLAIKKQGEWVPVKTIKETFAWDAKEGVLASLTNPDERWNYFHGGLVPLDRFYHHERAHQADYPLQNRHLQPVAQLSPQEMQDLLAHANCFEGFAGKQKNETKDCVIQVVANPRPLSQSPYMKNLNAQIPVHCGIRIITKEGSVYSTGFGSTLFEDRYNEGLRKYLGTINGQPTILDYEEFRSHEGRIVTSVPVSSTDAQEILKHLNEYREKTIRFNILKQNCMRLGTHVLNLAGVDLTIRITLGTMFFRALPGLDQLPLVGRPLKGVKKGVVYITGRTIPLCVKNTFFALSQLVFYVPDKALLVVKTVLLRAVGGCVGSPEHAEQEAESSGELEQFKYLVQGLFDQEAWEVHHSSIFINWQLKQPSTVVHAYTGQPSMHILPPKTAEQRALSESKKQEWRDMYKYSVPQ